MNLERAEAYRLLATCFSAPDRHALRQERTCLELAGTLATLYPDTAVAGAAAALRDALETTPALDLETDHAALFVGPFRLKAPPYGSIYLDAGRTLMGPSTLAAARRYAAAGLTLTLREPPDHVVVELEFMQYLATLTAQAIERGALDDAARLAREQDDFLAEHLGAWAPAFCAAVAQGAETSFYRSLADCLRGFVAAELPPSVSAEVEDPAAFREAAKVLDDHSRRARPTCRVTMS